MSLKRSRRETNEKIKEIKSAMKSLEYELIDHVKKSDTVDVAIHYGADEFISKLGVVERNPNNTKTIVFLINGGAINRLYDGTIDINTVVN